VVQKIFTVDITNQAYQEIEEICDYIAQDDPIRAISFGDELLAEAEKSQWGQEEIFTKLKFC